MGKRTPAEAEAAFWARVASLGGRAAPGARYQGSATEVPVICAAGHMVTPRPADLGQGRGLCRTCTKRDPRAVAAFWARVAELGGTPQPGAEYVNGRTPVPLSCAAGHDCRPKPTSLQQGQGICARCSNPRFRQARDAFWNLVAALGAQPERGAVFTATSTPVALRCARGHTCAPTPAQVLDRFVVCTTCGIDPDLAEAAFWAAVASVDARPAPGAAYRGPGGRVTLICAAGHACTPQARLVRPGVAFCPDCVSGAAAALQRRFWDRVNELGAAAADGATFANATTPVALRCAKGHECAPTPRNLLAGHGLCGLCAHNRPDQAAAAFWERVAGYGATPQPGAVYTDKDTPVPLHCSAGHTCSPTPANLRRGQGPCPACAYAAVSLEPEAEFWELVAEHGARPQPGAVYVKGRQPVPLICSAGHRCQTTPTYLRGGGGLCARCNVDFDRVYLLEHPAAGAIKVGVASGPRRVAVHTGRGYRLVACWTGLDHLDAAAAERALLQRWRAAGIEPVAGVPVDGRTETAPADQRRKALAFLTRRLGTPTARAGSARTAARP